MVVSEYHSKSTRAEFLRPYFCCQENVTRPTPIQELESEISPLDGWSCKGHIAEEQGWKELTIAILFLNCRSTTLTDSGFYEN